MDRTNGLATIAALFALLLLAAACGTAGGPVTAQSGDGSVTSSDLPGAQAAPTPTQVVAIPDQAASSSSDQPEARRGAPARIFELEIDDGSGPRSFRIVTEASPDLPGRPAEASGVFVRQEDNSIFLGTGRITLSVEVRQVDGGPEEPELVLDYDGPVVEVVTTRNTLIYLDVTEIPDPRSSDLEAGEYVVQQVLKPLDTLGEPVGNSEFQAWGKRSGDRIIADVLVYRIVS